MNHKYRLQAALDNAVSALNEALNVAQLVQPGATLYLQADGGLYVLKPEPPHSGDRTIAQRQTDVIAQAKARARCDVGAW